MTVPAALPSPGPTPLAAVGLPVGDATEDQAPADAFAALLAALGGGVVVPVPGVPLQPVPAGTTDPTALPDGALTGTAPAPAAPGVAGLADGSTPVLWEATTQRAHVVPDTVPDTVAGTGTRGAAGAPVATAPVADLAEPVPSATGPAVPAQPDPLADPAAPGRTAVLTPELTSEPETGPAPADAALAPAAVPTAAPAVPAPIGAPVAGTGRGEPVTSSHQVQPALVEAARGLRDEGGGRTSLVVRLDPPELGAVVVRLTVQDGRVDVQLRTPDVTARADLQAQAPDVQRVLRDNGFDLTSFDVAHGADQGGLAAGGRDDARTPDRGTPQHRTTADGRPGTSHVTDDAVTDRDDPQAAGTWL